MYRLVLAFFFSFATLPAFADCDGGDPRIASQIREIRTKWQALEKQLREIKEYGKVKELGTCGRFAARHLGLGGVSSHVATAAIDEGMSCLEVQEWALQKSCSCGKLGAGFSTDEDVADETEKSYNQAAKLASYARDHGIANPVIGRYVKMADSIRECFHKQTIATLKKINVNIQNELLRMRPQDESEITSPVGAPSSRVSTPNPPAANAYGRPQVDDADDGSSWLRDMTMPTSVPPMGAPNESRPSPHSTKSNQQRRPPSSAIPRQNESDITGVGGSGRATNPQPTATPIALSPVETQPAGKANGIIVNARPHSTSGNLSDTTNKVLEMIQSK